MTEYTDDEGVTVEQVDEGQLHVTIDGEPIHVHLEQWFSSHHHHFGRFRTRDALVASVRRYRREEAERSAEIELRQREIDEEGAS